jgi:hypothetical protein
MLAQSDWEEGELTAWEHGELTALGAQPEAACPKSFNAGCFTFSLSKGLKVAWCIRSSRNRCEGANDDRWFGYVCLTKTKNKQCGPIERMTAKWTGPFKCTKKICTSKGYYELDTITKGKTPPKVTNMYVYKQDVSSCFDTFDPPFCKFFRIGINVSK